MPLLVLIAMGSWSCSPQDAPALKATFPLCDGSSELRFVAQRGGSGTQLPGSMLMTQNGFDFIAIDGTCRYWVQSQPFADTKTGVLTARDVERLSDSLRFTQWSSYVGDYFFCAFDGPWTSLRLEQARVTVYPACGDGDTTAPIQWLQLEVSEAISSLYVNGTAVDGPVRFVLVKFDEDLSRFDRFGGAYWRAPVWPLEQSPRLLAHYGTDVNTEEEIAVLHHVVTGAQAEALRAVAAGYRAGEFGNDWAGFIPVKDVASNYYNFFLRTALPFEDETGRWQ